MLRVFMWLEIVIPTEIFPLNQRFDRYILLGRTMKSDGIPQMEMKVTLSRK